MQRSLKFSAALAALLVLSLGLKLGGSMVPLRADDTALQTAIATRLRAQGYSASPGNDGNVRLVTAKRGACQLHAMNMEAEGHLVSWFRQHAAQLGPVTFHYRGNSSTAFPRLRPPIEAFLQQTGFRLGINSRRPALIAVAASPACGNQLPDWAGLALAGTPATATAPG